MGNTKMKRKDLQRFVELKKVLEKEVENEEDNMGFFAEYLTDDLAYK